MKQFFFYLMAVANDLKKTKQKRMVHICADKSKIIICVRFSILEQGKSRNMYLALFTSATEGGWRLCFHHCLFVCEQDISECCGRIWTEFGGQVGCVIMTN